MNDFFLYFWFVDDFIDDNDITVTTKEINRVTLKDLTNRIKLFFLFKILNLKKCTKEKAK